MKVLVINWSWYPSGGDWTYIENLNKLYQQNNFEVIPFSTNNNRNFKTSYDQYFVNGLDFKTLNKNKTIKNGVKVLQSSIVSNEAMEKLSALLDAEPDIKVAHLHNVHHYITPAIINVLHNKGIKIIWTLHDFKIICPENSFLSNGKICEKCITGSFYHCATNKCKKNSYLASTMASIDAYYYHSKKIYDKVDAFLCPSAFLQSKFLQFGINPSKLVLAHSCYDISIIDQFITSKSTTNDNLEKYILYIGRLEEIKGVQTLIEATKNTQVKVKIVGTGNIENELKETAKDF
jgi:glycosyltransferase involved in cell wall biosynthesis